MEKSTLIEILKTFSKEELSDFEDFVQSPYYNKKSNVTKLYRVVKKFAPDFSAEKTAKEDVWKQIFPGKKYNYGIMKNLIFDLNRLAVKFMEMEKHSEKTFENDINLLDQYRLRNLKSLFIKKTEEFRKNLKGRPLDNRTYYYQYMLFNSEMSFLDYDYLFNSKVTDYHSGINESLMLFYCTNQIYHNINNLQYAYNRSAKFDKDIHEKTLKIYEDSGWKDPYTDILKLMYAALANPESREEYEKLKKGFFENYTKCAKSTQYDLATGMLNFCENNGLRGNREFLKEGFIYIKIMIEEKLYTSTTFKWIDQYVFMHSVMCACRANEYEWAEKFIEEHKHELIEKVKEQYTNYAYITLNLRRGRFEDALHYISKCRNVYEGDKLNIKVFEFNAYYELGYYDELKALADTTNHLLRSDKLFSKDNKTDYKNYVKAVCWLLEYKCNIGNKRKNKEFLPEVVSFINGNRMRNKSWLLKKAEELKDA